MKSHSPWKQSQNAVCTGAAADGAFEYRNAVQRYSHSNETFKDRQEENWSKLCYTMINAQLGWRGSSALLWTAAQTEAGQPYNHAATVQRRLFSYWTASQLIFFFFTLLTRMLQLNESIKWATIQIKTNHQWRVLVEHVADCEGRRSLTLWLHI